MTQKIPKLIENSQEKNSASLLQKSRGKGGRNRMKKEEGGRDE